MLRRGADAFEDRDALQLLLDEHARDARDTDAAEHEDHQAHEAQVVLGAREIFPEIVLGAAKRAHGDESVLERVLQALAERFHARLVHLEHHLVVRAAAEPEKPGARERVAIDQHARAEAEAAAPPARLAVEHAADQERRSADDEGVADGDAKLREQFGPHQDTVLFEQGVSIFPAVLQPHLAVQRERRVHAAQLHHPRDGLPFIRGPRHGRRIH